MRGPRILVADDEPLARSLLVTLIRAAGAGDVVAEASNVNEAVDTIRTTALDLVLLDVQMPEPDGFAVLARVGLDRMPPVVFVTAYEQYAVRAFEVHALDYLLKPVNPDRLTETVNRAMERTSNDASLVARLARLMASLERDRQFLARIPIRRAGTTRFIDVRTVERIEAADKLVKIFAHDGTSHTTRASISALEQQLDPHIFVRVHRSTIVNTGAIEEIQSWFDERFVLIMRSGARVTTGSVYRGSVRALMNGHAP